MVKKISTALFVLILLTAITLGYLYLNKQKEYKGTDPLTAVPVNSELILHFEDAANLISKLRADGSIWDELENFEAVKRINRNLRDLDSLLNQTGTEAKFNLHRPFTLASHLTGKNRIDYLFVLPLEDFLEENKLKNFIENITEPQNLVEERKYHGKTLYRIPSPRKGGLDVNYSFSNGLFLMSRSSLLLEDAIRQLSTTNSITQSKGFAQIQRTVGKNVDANIYLNLKTFPKQVSFLLDPQYSRYIRNFTNLGDWTELDLSVRKNLLLLNGFTFSDPQDGNYLNLFLKQEPVKMEVESILPANTSLLAMIGLEDPILFKGQYRKQLEKMGEIPQYQKNLNNIKSNTGADIEEILYPLIYKEMGVVFTGNRSDSRFAIIRTKSPSIARDKMLELVRGYAQKQQRTLSYYTYNYQLDRETKFAIFRLPEPDLMHQLFGGLFLETPTNYFTFIGNYMILGSSIKDLSEFIHDSVLGKTLASNNRYNQNKEFLSNKANFYFYTNMAQAAPIVSNYLDSDLKTAIQDHREKLKKFQSIGFQFSSSQDLIYNNLFVHYDPVLETPPQTDWESHLDTCFRHKPYLVRNHYTNEKEILVQDVNNQLYLINSSGRILWKKPLPSPIVGNVFQIDIYKNSKLQYLFATRDQLHLVDRNGNYVENYPIRLKSPTSIGLSLFDYDENRDYRLFLPCEDKRVYAYTKEGRIIPGWRFEKAENPIKGEIQHFRVNNKDYIVFADKFRVYLLNRRGEERVKPHQQFSKSDHNNFYLEKGNGKHSARLVTTDPSGMLYFLYFDGKVEKQQLDKFGESHFFVPSDMDSDGNNEYIIAEGTSLKIFDQNGKNLLSKDFPGTIDYSPDIYTFSHRKREIGLCLGKENQIHLLDLYGTSHEGFPLKGNTPFSIGFSREEGGSFNLYAGNDRNFLLNYSVQ